MDKKNIYPIVLLIAGLVLTGLALANSSCRMPRSFRMDSILFFTMYLLNWDVK